MTPCNTPATPPNFPDTLVAFSRMTTSSENSKGSSSSTYIKYFYITMQDAHLCIGIYNKYSHIAELVDYLNTIYDTLKIV